MVGPSDEDERTNSLGLFNTAEAYRLSARALSIRHGHADKPPRFLYCHAIELYLKALLRQKHSIATVRNKFGHQIKLLVREGHCPSFSGAAGDRFPNGGRLAPREAKSSSPGLLTRSKQKPSGWGSSFAK